MPGEDFIQKSMFMFGCGFLNFRGVATSVGTGANSAIQNIADTTGLQAGDKLFFATANVQRTILTVDSGSQVTLTESANTTNGEAVSKDNYVNDMVGVGTLSVNTAANTRMIFVAPTDLTTVYGKSWLIAPSEDGAPITIRFEDGTNINAMSEVSLSAAYSAAVLFCSGSGVFSCYVMTAVA